MTHSIHRRPYPSDLSDAQWNAIEPLVTPTSESVLGRKRETNLREVLNAINYRWTSGCVWRMLPHDLPSWNTVYTYCHSWEQAGVLSKVRHLLLCTPAKLAIERQELQTSNPLESEAVTTPQVPIEKEMATETNPKPVDTKPVSQQTTWQPFMPNHPSHHQPQPAHQTESDSLTSSSPWNREAKPERAVS